MVRSKRRRTIRCSTWTGPAQPQHSSLWHKEIKNILWFRQVFRDLRKAGKIFLNWNKLFGLGPAAELVKVWCVPTPAMKHTPKWFSQFYTHEPGRLWSQFDANRFCSTKPGHKQDNWELSLIPRCYTWVQRWPQRKSLRSIRNFSDEPEEKQASHHDQTNVFNFQAKNTRWNNQNSTRCKHGTKPMANNLNVPVSASRVHDDNKNTIVTVQRVRFTQKGMHSADAFCDNPGNVYSLAILSGVTLLR